MLRSRDAFNGKNDEQCAEAIDKVSVSLFCIGPIETWWDQDEDAAFSEEEWELQFANVLRPYSEARPFWEAIGWDLSDGEGDELACAHWFGRQIIALEGGLVGSARFTPDGTGSLAEDEDADDPERWGEGLLSEVEEWLKGRSG